MLPWIFYQESISDLPTKTVFDISHTHLNNTLSQDITNLTFEPLSALIDIHAKFNMSNITNTTTFQLLEKLDGSTYRQTKNWIWDTDNDDTADETIVLEFVGVGVDVKITMQSVVAEGSNKSVIGKKVLYTY